MSKDEILIDAADLFKMFGDSTRIRILNELLDNELCVNEIAERLNMTVSAISHQLNTLKSSKLIINRKDGKTVYYSLADDHVKKILNQGIEHVKEK